LGKNLHGRQGELNSGRNKEKSPSKKQVEEKNESIAGNS